MLRSIFTYGALAGAILLPFELAVAFAVPGSDGMAIGYLVMLAAFSMVFLGIKRRRDIVGGGVIGFWPALGFGLAISIVASIFYVISWEISMAFSGTDFIGAYADAVIAQTRAKGAGAAEIARVTASMNEMRASYANPLFRLPITFSEIAPVGLLVSLVSAGLLRNPRVLPVRARKA